MTFEHTKPSGKQEQAPNAERALMKRLAACEALFDAGKTTGDVALDELINDYVGMKAFNEVGGVMGDMAALERDKNLVLAYLTAHPNLVA